MHVLVYSVHCTCVFVDVYYQEPIKYKHILHHAIRPCYDHGVTTTKKLPLCTQCQQITLMYIVY